MMRNLNYIHYIILCLFFILLISCKSKEHISISGIIKNCPSEIIIIGSETNRDTIRIADDGTFSYEKIEESPNYYSLIIPKVRFFGAFWLENGKKTVITLDANDIDHMQIMSDSEAENKFLDNLFERFQKLNIKDDTSFFSFSKSVEVLSNNIIKESYELNNPKFTHYLEKFLHKKLMSSKCGYIDVLIEKGKPVDSDPDFNNFMFSIDPNSIENMNNNLTFKYILWKAQIDFQSSDHKYLNMLKILSQEVNDSVILNEFAPRLFRMLMTSNPSFENAQEGLQITTNIVSNSNIEKVNEFYINTMRPKGSIIPDFTLLTPERKEVSFHKICDKPIVYIDIWSTWCIPCCKEIPFISNLVEYYKNNPNIKFISISIDKNFSNWYSFLSKHSPTWEQYIVPEQEQDFFLKLFAINGIPRFIILDKESHLININANRPSSNNIVEYLDEVINL